MRYQVSSDFKGTLVCRHFNKILQANSKIEISDALLWEVEVERLIQRGILIPTDSIINQYIPQTIQPAQSSKDVEDDSRSVDNDHPTKSKVWDFQENKLIEATQIFKEHDVIKIDLEDKTDKSNEELSQEPNYVKKDLSKSIVIGKEQKEENMPKKRNVKGKDTISISPVGDIRVPLTVADAAIELDSRGNLLKNTSDIMIESVQSGDEIDFVY